MNFNLFFFLHEFLPLDLRKNHEVAQRFANEREEEIWDKARYANFE